MLRLQIASDLHLEFYDEYPGLQEFLIPSAPNLALLGDITAIGKPSAIEIYKQFLSDCSKSFETVLVLTGNHEYYQYDRKDTIEDVEIILGEIASEYDNIQYLQEKYVIIDGVRIIGCTLWGFVPEKYYKTTDPMQNVEYRMNDYRKIYVMGSSGKPPKEIPLECIHTNTIHKRHVAYIREQLREATESQQSAVVLTHHPPSFECIRREDPAFDSSIKYACASHQKKILSRHSGFQSLHTWAYGHTHFSCDNNFGNDVRVVSNQKGYPKDYEKHDTQYEPHCVLEIPNTIPEVPPSGCTIL